MRFKPGQKVVCIADEKWQSASDGERVNWGPKYGEIVTVQSYHSPEWVRLKEYERHGEYWNIRFQENHFQPLMDISELTEILNAETIEV